MRLVFSFTIAAKQMRLPYCLGLHCSIHFAGPLFLGFCMFYSSKSSVIVDVNVYSVAFARSCDGDYFERTGVKYGLLFAIWCSSMQ